MLYNGVIKQKYRILLEDYILDRHFKGEKLTCNDEQGSIMAVAAYQDIPKSIIKDWITVFHESSLKVIYDVLK